MNLTNKPLFQIVNIEKPACYLRKFSPCGKHLIAFSSDQASLEVYEFKGCAAASDLIGDWNEEVVPNVNKDRYYDIRSKIFERFFKVEISDVVGRSLIFIFTNFSAQTCCKHGWK